MRRRTQRQRLLLTLALLTLAAALAPPWQPFAWAQTADEVDLTVHLDAIASRDEAPSGDVTIEFIEASTREPVASYIVEASVDEQTLQVTVPAYESRSGWFAAARSEGWWSPTAYIAPEEREASLTLVPEGVVRFAVDGTDKGVDLLRTGQVWICGRVGSRGVRLDRRIYGGPCEVDRESDRREAPASGRSAALGQLESAAGNLLTVSFLAPSVLEIGNLRPTVFAATLGPDGEVEMSPDRGGGQNGLTTVSDSISWPSWRSSL